MARPGRRTNLALLLLLGAAFGSGWLAFGTGTPAPAWIVTVLHGAAGLGLLVLVPWKRVVMRRGFGRTVPLPGRWAGVGLGVLVSVSVVAGIAHAVFGPGTWFGLTALQVHVGAALLAVPLLAWHAVVRPQRLRRTDFSRRNALRVLGLAAAAGGVYLTVEGAAALLRLPGRRRRATGSYEAGSGDPDAMPVTQWVADPVPLLPSDSWRLAVSDSAGTRTLSYVDIAAGTDTVCAVLDCTGGWYAEQEWRGLRLDRVLPGARGAVDVVSATGYRRRLPAADLPHLLLATHAGGVPLSAGHGAPVRLVAPGRRGFWWVKWVVRVEVVDEPWWWQVPFPTQ